MHQLQNISKKTEAHDDLQKRDRQMVTSFGGERTNESRDVRLARAVLRERSRRDPACENEALFGTSHVGQLMMTSSVPVTLWKVALTWAVLALTPLSSPIEPLAFDTVATESVEDQIATLVKSSVKLSL